MPAGSMILVSAHERVGDVLAGAGKAARALKAYEARHMIVARLARADPGNAGWQRDLSVSHNKIGDVLRGPGQPDGGAGELPGLARYQRTPGREPTRAMPAGSAICRSRTTRSAMCCGPGQPDGGAGELPASLAIAERLARADPGNAGWQRDLSVSHNKIGDVLVEQGDLTAALESYQA